MVPTITDSYPVIYLIKCISSGKIYVGSTKNFYYRHNFYYSRYRNKRKGRAIEAAMQKYGFDKFVFSILERVDNIKDLITREQYWIDQLQPFKSNIGYNQNPTAGSNLGFRHSLESRQRMKTIFKGRKHSKESIEARAALQRGVPKPKEQVELAKLIKLKKFLEKQKPVVQIDVNTLQVIARFSSAYEAAKALEKKNFQEIRKVCLGTKISAYGSYWCYADQYNFDTFKPKEKKQRISYDNTITSKRPIIQLDTDYKFVCRWNNAKDAGKSVNAKSYCIHRAIKNEFCSYGFYWKYGDSIPSVGV